MPVLRPVLFHYRAKEEVRALPTDVRVKLGSALMALQRGFNLAMPLSRPMPAVRAGVDEFRLRGESGHYRVFYYRKSAAGVLVLRAFQKKTPETPRTEIELARRRLTEMLNEYEEVGRRT
jgi:phage-related protein